ncbi:MAG: hypothetical protein PCFJNLEI_03603 [Verrucomicrobiae bacterium]|nr:hypothetical protein [Verrucomicrobiae bacterium]
MKTTLKTTWAVAVLTIVIAGVNPAQAETVKMKDRTHYDCRIVTGYKMEKIGKGNIQVRRPIFACPHKDLVAAGKCESNWLGQMRCKE